MIRADLHIHSCLSPCGDLDMGPSAVVERVKQQGISVFAIADHNSTRNCRAFVEVATSQQIRCIPAIEVTTSEEAHILCYFDDLEAAEAFGLKIEQSLLPIALDEDKMGMEIALNKDEEVIEMLEQYLSVASGYSVSNIVDLAHEYGGVVVPAHVDKPVYSILSQLGFITDDPFDAIEVSYGCLKRGEQEEYHYKAVLSSSDAHYIDDIGRVYFESDALATAPVEEIISKSTTLHLG